MTWSEPHSRQRGAAAARSWSRTRCRPRRSLDRRFEEPAAQPEAQLLLPRPCAGVVMPATARSIWYAKRGAERARLSALARGRSGVGVDLKRVVGLDHLQPAVLGARSVTGEPPTSRAARHPRNDRSRGAKEASVSPSHEAVKRRLKAPARLLPRGPAQGRVASRDQTSTVSSSAAIAKPTRV